MFGSLILANHFLISLHPSKQLLHVVANHLYGRLAYSYHVLVWSNGHCLLLWWYMSFFFTLSILSLKLSSISKSIWKRKIVLWMSGLVNGQKQSLQSAQLYRPLRPSQISLSLVRQFQVDLFCGLESAWSTYLREMLCLWWGRWQLQDSCKDWERFYDSTKIKLTQSNKKTNHFPFFDIIVNELD